MPEPSLKYDQVFDNIPAGIFIIGQEGQIKQINKEGGALLNISRDKRMVLFATDLLGTALTEFTAEEQKKLQQGEQLHKETELLNAAGAKICCDVVIVLLPDNDIMLMVTDITTKKRTEDEVLKMNERFQIISEATHDLVWDWNLQTGDLWWNNNYYQSLGYKKEREIVNIEDWYRHIHPDDEERVRKKAHEVFAGQETIWRDEYRYQRADGSFREFLDRGFIIRNKDGHAIRMIGSMSDMTPIYNAQRKMEESENRLRTIIETNPDWIALFSRNCELYETNDAGLTMLGADNFGPLYGQSVLKFISEEHQGAFEKMIRNSFKGKTGKMEFELNNLKKQKKWCEVNIVPFRDSENIIMYALGVVTDISQRRKAETELKQSEEKYRTLVEQAADAIILYDVEGRLLDVNSGAAELLGFSKDELEKMNLLDIIWEDDLAVNPVKYEPTGKSTVRERKLKHRSGNMIETEARSQQLLDGKFLLVVRDISDRIRAEEELRKSYQEVVALTGHLQNIREEERTNMAREIHDELGQRLTVMKMDVSWLNKKLGGSDQAVKEKMKELLNMLDSTVKTVRRISSELRPSLLDDMGLTAAMEWQLKEFEKRSGIHTELEAPGENTELPNKTRTALFRIFQESLTNVARHSKAKNVKVCFEKLDGDYILSIADDGKGFNSQKIADKKTLGILGMSERAAMVGGKYKIKSKPGEGTKVTVSIPVTEHEI